MKNEGTVDRVVRGIVALVFLFVGITVSGAWGVLFIILAIAMGFTAATGTCFLYKVFGINTSKEPQQTDEGML